MYTSSTTDIRTLRRAWGGLQDFGMLLVHIGNHKDPNDNAQGQFYINTIHVSNSL
jgi:hypothetical protein